MIAAAVSRRDRLHGWGALPVVSPADRRAWRRQGAVGPLVAGGLGSSRAQGPARPSQVRRSSSSSPWRAAPARHGTW